jgi:hypothetical protein
MQRLSQCLTVLVDGLRLHPRKKLHLHTTNPHLHITNPRLLLLRH